jgi:hypothetical protein
MKLLNKMVEYREFNRKFPIIMPAHVLADVGDGRVMVLNADGDVKVLKKSDVRVMR